jgi:hypothetical protein
MMQNDVWDTADEKPLYWVGVENIFHWAKGFVSFWVSLSVFHYCPS